MSRQHNATTPKTGHYYCIQYDQYLAYFLGKPGWFEADIMREERPVPCNTEAVAMITELLRENDQEFSGRYSRRENFVGLNGAGLLGR
jgi:hypothetical protein